MSRKAEGNSDSASLNPSEIVGFNAPAMEIGVFKAPQHENVFMAQGSEFGAQLFFIHYCVIGRANPNDPGSCCLHR